MNKANWRATGTPGRHLALGAATWMVAWLIMLWSGTRLDLANLAMMLVLAATVAAFWLPMRLSVLFSSASVCFFNWCFVPPRKTFAVDLPENGFLLGAMLLVSWIVAVLMARQQVAARRAGEHARRAEQLRRFGEALRDGTLPSKEPERLEQALVHLVEGRPKLLVFHVGIPKEDDPDAVRLIGDTTPDERAGLWQCARGSVAFGPGTHRYDGQPDWYLPLRGGAGTFGAAVLRPRLGTEHDVEARSQAQALCDQFGLALERELAAQAASEARELAQAQSLRNVMLAAISHDYRTPLATILSAASSLAEQGERLAPHQRQRLAETIVEETVQLARLTDNTLQLARLNSAGVQLKVDWESAEEIVGTVLRRSRRHDPSRRVRARLDASLPLVRCDALLLSQMLDNLVDNALKYSDPPAPVELVVRRQDKHLVFAVQDRGPGVSEAWRERIFEVFQRGAALDSERAVATARSGAGVGLAVCRAIARAHGGDMRYRARQRGGSSFEFLLPEATPPQMEEEQPVRTEP